jgi:membrane protein DedA with SNARE-associated domain
MLSAVGTRLLWIIEAIGYQGIAFAMFAENVFPPIPSELIMPFGGFLAWMGEMTLVGVILAGVIGTYVGVLVFYVLGWFLHKEKLLKRTDRWGKWLGLSREEVELAFTTFQKRGPAFVFFGRFIPLFRTIISFPAGAMRMNFWSYSAYTLAWSLVWCSLLATVGYILWDQWELVWSVMKQYEHILLGVIALVVILFFWHKVVRWVKNKKWNWT